MPIDVHAHYVPRSILETIESRAADFGLSVVQHPPTCSCALHFDHGAKIRPFFAKLIEPVDQRLAGMAEQGIDRQVLSMWADIFGYGMTRDQLTYAVEQLGAVGAVVSANIADINLGECDLDPLWQTAVDLDVGVFIHPVMAEPSARVAKFALSQVAQYTFDSTLCVGSLIGTGVMDRFPTLRFLLSHGGGTYPYLTGRFDCMHVRMDRKAQADIAAQPPSTYRTRFYYDTILHDPAILTWLATRVSVDRIVLGSDYSFPPADMDPIGTVKKAGFTKAEQQTIAETNPRVLFPKLKA
jgi:aminocarboxymuconate-semialdehyde decarboxylase